MKTDTLNTLTDYLNKLGHGLVSDHGKTLMLLSGCWEALEGSDDQRTSADKLYRAEKLSWDGSILSFILERHGATVNGSSRAEVHHWEVNINTRNANILKKGVKQLYPMSPRMNFKMVAEGVANQILTGEQHENIQWRTDDYVVLNIGEVIPETNQQTTTYRRKRFRGELETIMSVHGWKRDDFGNKMGFIRPDTP